MTTVLIVICAVFCLGVIAAIVGHLGFAITRDHRWRIHIHRHHRARRGSAAG